MKSNLKKPTSLMVIILFSSLGCHSQSHQTVFRNTAITVAPPSQQAGNEAEYRFGYGDLLEIKFFNNNEFNETVRVLPDGRISLQRIGSFKIIGMTPTMLQKVIEEKYASFLRQPEVTVFVRETASQVFYCMGEVNNPGIHPIAGHMTIYEAIALAGGVTEKAKLQNVFVLRPLQNERLQTIKINMSKISSKNRVVEDYAIQPKDIVYVPKTLIADITTLAKQIYDGVLPPADVYLRALWYR
jgi:polysaccharide biosynthesis/export protein